VVKAADTLAQANPAVSAAAPVGHRRTANFSALVEGIALVSSPALAFFVLRMRAMEP
jgi:hypothetical protein